MSQRPHLSPSQLEMFARCPEQWRRAYLGGDRVPPGIAMLKGTGVHRAAQTNFAQKIETHRDLSVEQITEAAVEGFRAETRAGYSLDPEEQSRGAKVVIGEAIDQVAALGRVHAEQQAPDYQPVLVEHRFRLTLPGKRDLVGVIDLADDLGRVTDFKTTTKSKSQQEADSSLQLTIYHVAHRAVTGEPTVNVQLDQLVQSAKEIKRSVLVSSRDRQDTAALAARIDAVSASIDAGIFPPAPPGAWWCSPKFCGFHRTCRFVNGRRQSQGD